MAFDTQTVTLKGAELLAAATAADPLIIVGCDATQTYLTQAQAVNISTRPATPFSNTTSVTQLGSATDHINSRVYFRAGDNTGGDANTLMLYGHKQSAPSDDYVIFVASAQTPFHLPVVGDVVDECETALDIVYTVSTNSVGYATQATYCSLSEFNLLKERTVTTHAEGEPTTGDNQTIYGYKDFVESVDFDSEVNFNGDLFANNGLTVFSGELQACDRLVVSDTIGLCNVIGSLKRFETTFALDALSRPYVKLSFPVYSDAKPNVLLRCGASESNIDVNATYVNITGGVIVTGTFSTSSHLHIGGSLLIDNNAQINGYLLISDAKISSSTSSTNTQMDITLPSDTALLNVLNVNNADVIVSGDLTSKSVTVKSSSSYSSMDVFGLSIYNDSQGSSSNRILLVSPQQNKTTIGNSSNDSSLYVYGDATITKSAVIGTAGSSATNLVINGKSSFSDTITVGTSGDTSTRLMVFGKIDSTGDFVCSDVTCSDISADDVTLSGDLNASTIGKTATFNNVVINGTISAAGLAPSLSGSTISIPIGGIVGIYAVGNGDMGTITVGQSKTISANQFKPCRWDVDNGVWAEDLYYVPAGTYRALTAFLNSINAGTAGPVFFIRVA